MAVLASSRVIPPEQAVREVRSRRRAVRIDRMRVAVLVLYIGEILLVSL
jgi:hypothetical protein